jgi:hypothetical protein
MHLRRFWWAYVASAIATTCGVCIFAFLKSATRAACANGDSQQLLSSSQSQTITASLALAATAVVTSAAFLVLKSRAKQGLALAAAICAKWQPAYFLLVLIERIVFLVVMVAKDESAGSCGFSLHQHGQILATELLIPVALLFFSLSAICCDFDPDVTPAMRRGAYCASTACFVLDMICSIAWGFGTKTDQGYLSFGPFRFLLANQITSCIMSQVVVSFHFLYVSCRSRGGRGWAYASLRFELVKQYNMGVLLNEPSCCPMASRMPSCSDSGALEGVQGGDVQVQVKSNVFSRLRHRFLRFQRRRLQASQVFAIPCVESDCNLSTALTASGLQLARPFFRIKFPATLVRFAELHASLYSCVVFIVGLLSVACSNLELTGTAAMVLNFIVIYGFLGFISCKRHNIDSIAAKHVSTSFRFGCICLFLVFVVALEIHLYYLGQRTLQNVVAFIIMVMAFILCLLVDCSPKLPTAVQTAISVRACIVPIR